MPDGTIRTWPTAGRLSDHDRRMVAARRAAEWYLGSAHWADQLITYYLNPSDAMPFLEGELSDA